MLMITSDVYAAIISIFDIFHFRFASFLRRFLPPFSHAARARRFFRSAYCAAPSAYSFSFAAAVFSITISLVLFNIATPFLDQPLSATPSPPLLLPLRRRHFRHAICRHIVYCRRRHCPLPGRRHAAALRRRRHSPLHYYADADAAADDAPPIITPRHAITPLCRRRLFCRHYAIIAAIADAASADVTPD